MRPEDVKTVIPDGLIKSCCHLCHCCCEVVVTVGDGAVKKIEGDPSSPHSRGMLCSKGLASRQLLYHPERLTRPLMRVGERGEGRWREASWEEALGTIAERLLEIRERYGPQAVAFGQGTDRGWFNVFVRLANSFGSPNWGEPGMAQCFYPRATASALTFGTELMECPSYEKTRCMLLWGIKPSATWAQKASYMMDARARGARLIVVDPRFIPMAAKADIWLRPRPGTDCALALGMLNVILEEGLYERDFIERWTIGFEELRARAGEYPLAKVETITWVPAEKIRAAARLFAENKPACITQCLALDQNIDTIQTSRAINLLTALTGNVDIPGGNVMDMFVGSGYPDIWRQNFERRDAISEEMWEKRLGAREYPLLSGREAILAPGAHMPTVWEAMLAGKPYPIKAMVIHGSNTVVSFAHSQRVREALLTLDFISVAECFMTETTSIADVILPAGTWLEWDSVIDSFQASYNIVLCQQKVAEVGEAWSDTKIILELAKRLGLAEHFWESEEEMLDGRLKPLGITFDEFRKLKRIVFPFIYRKYEKKGFNTPSGKVELSSSILKRLGHDPLPFYTEPHESPESTPELAQEFPLILTSSGRVPVFRHTEHRMVPWLREIVPEPIIDLHPETARELGIDDGEAVVVESPRGSLEGRAKLSPDLHPRVLQTPPGWERHLNANRLTPQRPCAPLIGTTPFRGLLCRVRRADGGREREAPRGS